MPQRILLVERQSGLEGLVRRAAGASGWQVLVASGTEDALRQASGDAPDVLVIGPFRSYRESFRFHRRLADSPRTREIPTLLLDVDGSSEGGAPVPLEPDELQLMIAEVLAASPASAAG